jgi:hypothetical protein
MTSNSWHSYPSIFNLGHKAVGSLLNVPHYIEEKVDGSQFSFGIFSSIEGKTENPLAGEPLYVIEEFELRIRSKGAQMVVDAPMAMFKLGAETVKRLGPDLHPGWTYRGEFLAKPKHNTLAYDRAPAGNVILFDVEIGDQEFLTPEQKRAEAERLGLECVPVLAWDKQGGGTSLGQLRSIIDGTKSVLGGQTIEGIVIKQLGPGYLYGQDSKVLMGKFVSERFKEAHKLVWGENNPTSGDILTKLGAAYGTQARWMKAVQHLKDAGLLEDSPRDIGKLLIECQKDIGQECKEEIQKALWKWAWPHVSRMVTRGMPEWYKQYLLEKQFEAGTVMEPEVEVLDPDTTPAWKLFRGVE